MKAHPKIRATVIADSIWKGARVSTLQISLPKFLLAELNTHKLLSRNYGSSRARKRSIMDQVSKEPFIPHWMAAQARSMHNTTPVSPEALNAAQADIRHLSEAAVKRVAWLERQGVHKQHYNRYLEPWAVVEGVITACHEHRLLYYEMNETKARLVHPWIDMLMLRTAEEADPAMRDLAYKIRYALDNSTPMETTKHYPYTDEEDRRLELAAMVSAARCARVSYKDPTTGAVNIEGDHDLAMRLIRSGHASPFEHVLDAEEAGVYANFSGWKSLRWRLGL